MINVYTISSEKARIFDWPRRVCDLCLYNKQ